MPLLQEVLRVNKAILAGKDGFATEERLIAFAKTSQAAIEEAETQSRFTKPSLPAMAEGCIGVEPLTAGGVGFLHLLVERRKLLLRHGAHRPARG